MVYINGVMLQLNESFKSGHHHVYLIPYEEFYVPELREKVDLQKDFVKWLHVSGSTVLQYICSAFTDESFNLVLQIND